MSRTAPFDPPLPESVVSVPDHKHASGPAALSRGLIPPLIALFLFVDLLFAAIYPIQERYFGDVHTFAADFFDLDQESNAPAWWSSLQLALTGVVLLGFAWQMVERSNKRSWVLWLAPLMFLFLSLDEAAMIHESIGRQLDELVDLTNREKSIFKETGVWMLFCGPLLVAGVALIAWSAAKYFRGRKRIALHFVIGFGLFIGAATGVEMMSNFVGDGFGYTLETLIEETGELLGETVLLWAALALLKSHHITIFRKSDPAPIDA